MSFLDKIFGGVKKAAEEVKSVFVKIFGEKASADFAKSAEEILKSDFGKVVLSIVSGLTSVAAAQGGAAARDAAFKAVKDQAVASGLDIKDSLINLLIELAVNTLKGTISTGALAL